MVFAKNMWAPKCTQQLGSLSYGAPICGWRNRRSRHRHDSAGLPEPEHVFAGQLLEGSDWPGGCEETISS